MGLLEALTVLFVGLKLAAVIDWSWWAVLSPIWAGYAVIFLGAMMLTIVNHIQDRRRD